MRWIRSGLQSLSGWVQPPLATTRASSDRLEAIRQSMLETLGPAGESRWPALSARIRFCREVDTLWALRIELMDASLQLYGEPHALRRLTRVTALFEGLVSPASCAQRNQLRPRIARWGRH